MGMILWINGSRFSKQANFNKIVCKADESVEICRNKANRDKNENPCKC